MACISHLPRALEFVVSSFDSHAALRHHRYFVKQFIASLQMKKIELREIRLLAQHHTIPCLLVHFLSK